MDQVDNPARCWYDPQGQRHDLNGKSHSEFAYEILLNQKLGEHMSKKLSTDGSGEHKGKSGEHAKADAEKELGDPCSPKHTETLRGQGWVQASILGDRLFIRAEKMEPVKAAWPMVSSTGQKFGSVVFAIGHSGSGVTAGLSGKDLVLPMESVIVRLTEAALGGSAIWPPRCHNVKYFE